MRKVRIRATWQSDHEIEVEDNAPKIETLDEFIAVEDIDPTTAELIDWKITDRGPVSER